jgi:hypothetical protein
MVRCFTSGRRNKVSQEFSTPISLDQARSQVSESDAKLNSSSTVNYKENENEPGF